MKEITSLYVTQWRVFKHDVVPYRRIVTVLGTSLLKQAFEFRNVAWSTDSFDYLFQDGTLVRDAGAPIPITQVAFNERRIAVQVLGDTEAAHAAYSALHETLVELDPAFRNADPLNFTEETSCVAQLDFEWTALLSPALVDHVKRLASDLSTEKERKSIKTVSVRFTLGTTITDEWLKGYGVFVNDQTVAVEPRADTPLQERIYFTYSPSDSDGHLKRLEALEATLSKKTSKRRRGG